MAKTLGEQTQELFYKYKQYLQQNDIVGFYHFAWEDVTAHSGDLNILGMITDTFLQKGIDPLQYVKGIVPSGYGYGCRWKEIIIPSHIRKIGAYAYAANDATKIIWQGAPEIIGLAAFSYCGHLKKVVIPEGVTTLEEGCFSYTDLEDITIPSTIEQILPEALMQDEPSALGIHWPKDKHFDSVVWGSAGRQTREFVRRHLDVNDWFETLTAEDNE